MAFALHIRGKVSVVRRHRVSRNTSLAFHWQVSSPRGVISEGTEYSLANAFQSCYEAAISARGYWLYAIKQPRILRDH